MVECGKKAVVISPINKVWGNIGITMSFCLPLFYLCPGLKTDDVLSIDTKANDLASFSLTFELFSDFVAAGA